MSLARVHHPRFEAPTASDALPDILQYLMNQGHEVGSRNGRVFEALNAQIVLTDPRKREILNPHRGANVFAQIAETMWILAGRNDIGWLSAYLPRAGEFSDDGVTWRGGYGPRIRGWRMFNGSRLDQLAHVVDILLDDPLSRRAVISIYDPAVDTDPGKDIPCNDFLQFQSRLGELHLTVTVRSNDVMWGWSGINAFEWSTLQEVVASVLGINVGPLTFNVGSLHLYEQHWAKASRITDDVYAPAFIPFDGHRAFTSLEDVDLEVDRWFTWEARAREGLVEPTGLGKFRSPLVRAWAAAIAYYWQRDDHWLEEFADTRLAVAVARTPRSLLPTLSEPSSDSLGPVLGAGTGHGLPEPHRAFYEFVTDLHAKKHASYGDSWRKRGEMLSILPNIARKVDRLGVGDEFDSAADTLIDLWVYTAKYLNWLRGNEDTPEQVDLLLLVSLRDERHPEKDLVTLIDDWDRYMDYVQKGNLDDEQKQAVVSYLLIRVAPMALTIWLSEITDHAPRNYAEQRGLLDNSLVDVDEYRGADVD